MFNKSEFLKEIKSGLYQAWHLAFATNDTPYVSMRPEYLTTIMLGKHLSEILAVRFPSQQYLVRFEEPTKDVATRAFSVLPPPHKPKNVHGRAKKSSGEEGLVDITIYEQTQLLPETKVVIEVKNFDQRDELLIKDIDRNLEFMELTDPHKTNHITMTFLTFYLFDKGSQTKEEADQFIANKIAHYQPIVNTYNKLGIRASLELNTLTNYPLLSNAEALSLDEDGQQRIAHEENHHIVYATVCLEK